MSTPESQLPPNLYYNQEESVKYTNCNRIINIQTYLSERAIQILDLNLDECSLVLDIGCGSGISGFYLTQKGVNWVGLDISESMLNVAQQEKTEGELLLCDIGQGFKFRPEVFDAAISISVIQFLCLSFKKSETLIEDAQFSLNRQETAQKIMEGQFSILSREQRINKYDYQCCFKSRYSKEELRNQVLVVTLLLTILILLKPKGFIQVYNQEDNHPKRLWMLFKGQLNNQMMKKLKLLEDNKRKLGNKKGKRNK